VIDTLLANYPPTLDLIYAMISSSVCFCSSFPFLLVSIRSNIIVKGIVVYCRRARTHSSSRPAQYFGWKLDEWESGS
jgi:hypothetical protein